MVKTKYYYQVVFLGKKLSHKYSERESKMALKRIYAGYKGQKKLPKSVPRKIGFIVKTKVLTIF